MTAPNTPQGLPELLPCPFCGEQPELSNPEWRAERRYVAMDISCCSEMTVCIGWKHAKDMTKDQISSVLNKRATNAWNRRSDSAELAKAQEEIERLNKWADSFTDAHLKERQTGDALIKELRQEIAQLRATPTAPADLVEALRPFASLLQNHNNKGDDESPLFAINDAKITRGDLRKACDIISRYEAAQQTKGTDEACKTQ